MPIDVYLLYPLLRLVIKSAWWLFFCTAFFVDLCAMHPVLYDSRILSHLQLFFAFSLLCLIFMVCVIRHLLLSPFQRKYRQALWQKTLLVGEQVADAAAGKVLDLHGRTPNGSPPQVLKVDCLFLDVLLLFASCRGGLLSNWESVISALQKNIIGVNENTYCINIDKRFDKLHDVALYRSDFILAFCAMPHLSRMHARTSEFCAPIRLWSFVCSWT